MRGLGSSINTKLWLGLFSILHRFKKKKKKKNNNTTKDEEKKKKMKKKKKRRTTKKKSETNKAETTLRWGTYNTDSDWIMRFQRENVENIAFIVSASRSMVTRDPFN